jgi:hypothetical protein
MRTSVTLAIALASAVACASACSSGSPASPNGPGAPGPTTDNNNQQPPFEPESPVVYVAKVKNILVGLPPTDDELAAVIADPTKLKDLIDGWMKLPQYQEKMMVFFELAFQQTQVTIADFADQAYPRQADLNGNTQALLVQNAKESFARTVLQLVSNGQPLTAAMTTQQLMMTPALMEFYAYLDWWQVDDDGKVQDAFRQAYPTASITVTAQGTQADIKEILDPTSPNFMHWVNPAVAQANPNAPAGCQVDPIVYPPTGSILHFLMQGSLDNYKNPGGAGNCPQRGGTATSGQLTADDFAQWKMVTIRAPKAGEKPTAFFDIPTLRTTNELVLSVPRVGFFSTPAFFANWQTNTSNQMRVTTNQMLIVALGAAIDGTDTTTPSSTPGLDSAHASEPACFGCHQTLDPTRSILASTFSWNYHRQTEQSYAQQKGLFAFQGVIQQVANAQQLGDLLSKHPLFPSAWVEKLCYYANSQKCEPDDPEFQRVVGVFHDSGFSWNVLVKELLSSPLTTYATPTASATKDGEIIAVSRRDHLCAALNARLGFADICGLDDVSRKGPVGTIPQIVSGLPSDGYGRGSIAPVLPNDPSLFYRAGIENICEAVAAMVIDVAKPVAGQKTWASAQPDAAIGDFVHIIMALPSTDPRASDAQAVLKDHFTQATGQGASAADALKSTFVVSCLAPSTVAIGL